MKLLFELSLLAMIAGAVGRHFGVLDGVAAAGAVWLLMPYRYVS